jgi:mannuronan 5-epimerase
MLVAGLTARAATPASQGGDGEIIPGPHAAWDVDAGQAPAERPLAAPGVASAPTDCLGSPTRKIRYTSAGILYLEGCGQVFTLSDIRAAPGISTSHLELVDAPNKVWLLKVKLKITEGATLQVVGGAAGDANQLRLRSDPAGAVWLWAENGNLLLQDTSVTSWDTAAGAVDTDINVAADGSGGRAYIRARSVLTRGRETAAPTACDVRGGSQEPYEGRLDVINSRIAYLGYPAPESYGITWKVYYDSADPSDILPGRQLYEKVDVFGTVSGSTFDHNYFGSYTYGAYCMNWTGNTFAENIEYGLDPHDDSDSLTISGNTFRDNGNHGLICSVECSNLVITGNQSYNNRHGIMLHRNTNGALVEGNTVYNNRQDGIAIFDSHNNIVRNNTVTNNISSTLRLSVGSSGNLIVDNTLTGLAADQPGPGYVLYTYKGTDLPTTGDGLPKNNIFRNNRITAYKRPALKITDATANLFEGNTFDGPVSEIEFRIKYGGAGSNRIRDAQVGKPLQISLDAGSTVTLEDSRGYVWALSRSGLSTTAAPGGSKLELSFANVGGSVTVTPLDLAVLPAKGSVAVQPLTLEAESRSWIETSSTATGAVAHTAGGLAAGGCYGVTANGAPLGPLRADSSGRIAFAYGGSYSSPVTFTVAKAADCTEPPPEDAPQLVVYLPFIANG